MRKLIGLVGVFLFFAILGTSMAKVNSPPSQQTTTGSVVIDSGPSIQILDNSVVTTTANVQSLFFGQNITAIGVLNQNINNIAAEKSSTLSIQSVNFVQKENAAMNVMAWCQSTNSGTTHEGSIVIAAEKSEYDYYFCKNWSLS